MLDSVYALRYIPQILPPDNRGLCPDYLHFVANRLKHYLIDGWAPENRDQVVMLASLLRLRDLKADNLMLIPQGEHYFIKLFDYDAMANADFRRRIGLHFPENKFLWPIFFNPPELYFTNSYSKHFRSILWQHTFIELLEKGIEFYRSVKKHLSPEEELHVPPQLYNHLRWVQSHMQNSDTLLSYSLFFERLFSPPLLMHYALLTNIYSNQPFRHHRFQSALYNLRMIKSIEALQETQITTLKSWVSAEKSFLEYLEKHTDRDLLDSSTCCSIIEIEEYYGHRNAVSSRSLHKSFSKKLSFSLNSSFKGLFFFL